MKNQTMLAKTIELQKTAFVATISIISTMQQHGEDLLKTSLEQNPWLQGSSKRACLDMTNIYSKYWENIKSVTDQGFEVIEKISSTGTKPEAKESKQTKSAEQTSGQGPIKKSPTVRKKTAQSPKTVKAKPSPKKKSVDENVLAEKQPLLKQAVGQKSKQAKPIDVKTEKAIHNAASLIEQKISSSGENVPAEKQPLLKHAVEKKI